MNAITEDIKNRLVDAAGSPFTDAGEQDWGVHLDSEPAKPNNVVTVYSTSSRDQLLRNNPDQPVTDFAGFQVRIRGTKYFEVFKKIKQVQGIISHKGRFIATATDSSDPDTSYADIIPQGSPIRLERDQNERHVWVVNFYAIREDVS